MSERFDLDGIRARLRALDARRITGDAPRAAVLVSLCEVNGAPAVLFTKRTDTVSTHKGQVSFPGGRMDPGDDGEIACALRELEEELGFPREKVDVLGRFHDVMSITSVRVTPIVGFLGEVGDLSMMTPAPAEIDAVFALTVDELLDESKRERRELRDGREGTFFLAGPHPVWGLTAFILEEVMRELL